MLTNPVARLKRLITSRFSRDIFQLAFPLALQSAVHSGLGIIDRIMVGSLQETAISGVGIGGQTLFFTANLCGAIAAGASILAAQLRGRGDIDGLKKLTGAAFALSGIMGLVFAVTVFVFAQSLSMWLSGQNAAISVEAAGFIRITIVTAPFVLWTFVITGIMRALGDTKTPLISGALTIGCNTALNALLIFGMFGFPKLGVTGAALATATSEILGFAVSLYFFRNLRWKELSFRFSYVKTFSSSMAIRILKVSMPILLDALFWQAASLTYTKVVGLNGQNALAAYFIFQGFRSMGYIPLGAIGISVATLTGVFLGADHRKRADTLVSFAMRLSIFFSGFMGLGYIAFASLYLTFFNVQPSVAATSILLIRLFAFVIPFEGIIVMLANVLRSGGDGLAVSVITLSTFWLVGIPSAWFFSTFIGWGMPGFFLGTALESISKSLFFYFRRARANWARNLVARTS
ncbi:MAG: MATE family efflux transporter [Candidatus Riflebacteria bacterium]|nr:MATE family efflux transporter [Candidatus Riflebacteria bacterium]